MARLDQLTDNFMQSFLRNNPKSLVDSNGYLRSEYEAELARRAAYVPPSPANSVPDPRSYPQFKNIPFESDIELLFPSVEPSLPAENSAISEEAVVVPALGEDQKYAVDLLEPEELSGPDLHNIHE
jgi:hypothetical protein